MARRSFAARGGVRLQQDPAARRASERRAGSDRGAVAAASGSDPEPRQHRQGIRAARGSGVYPGGSGTVGRHQCRTKSRSRGDGQRERTDDRGAGTTDRRSRGVPAAQGGPAVHEADGRALRNGESHRRLSRRLQSVGAGVQQLHPPVPTSPHREGDRSEAAKVLRRRSGLARSADGGFLSTRCTGREHAGAGSRSGADEAAVGHAPTRGARERRRDSEAVPHGTASFFCRHVRPAARQPSVDDRRRCAVSLLDASCAYQDLRHPLRGAISMNRTWMWTAAVLALSVALPAGAIGQEMGSVVGRVTQRGTDQPLADVQIMVAGTASVTRTNEEGRFRFPNVSVGSVTLRVVRLGYAAQSRTIAVAAAQSTTADFTLVPVALTLDQIMVTATGETERRRESGISIGSIDSSQLNPASVTNLSTVLAARTPGVSVLSSTGSSGLGSRIRIRGSNSINLSNDPLLIVDGVRVNNLSTALSISLAGQTISRMDDLNGDDIESIEVIKGPAASALYGTAAASGVIQVSTKRGRAGRTRWNSFVEYGLLNDVTTYPENWSQIGTITGGALNGQRTSRCTIESVALNACAIRQDSMYRYSPLENPAATPFRQGFRNKYGLNAAGGADVATYFVAGEFEREQGIYDPNMLKTANLRANLRAQLRPNLDATLTTAYLSSHNGVTFNDNSAQGPIGA